MAVTHEEYDYLWQLRMCEWRPMRWRQTLPHEGQVREFRGAVGEGHSLLSQPELSLAISSQESMFMLPAFK
jgi:hypothetical protein